MSLFAISDMHLSLSSNKSMEVFPGWKDYVNRLKNGFTSAVKEEDTVVLAGDSSWGMSLEESLLDFKFINDLPGTKLLIKGNHDYWWSTKTKMEKFFEENGLNKLKIIHNNSVLIENIAVCGTRGWLYNGQEPEDIKVLAREAGRLKASLQSVKDKNTEIIVFLHYPPVYGNDICWEIMDILKENNINKCYYGHIHGQTSGLAIKGNYLNIDFRLISCDHTGFVPIKIS